MRRLEPDEIVRHTKFKYGSDTEMTDYRVESEAGVEYLCAVLVLVVRFLNWLSDCLEYNY